VKGADPKLLICAAVALATIGFLLIDPYVPFAGPLENALIGTIPIGVIQLPYRYVLVFTTLVIGLAFYTLKEPSVPKR
jgi:hypothetical protein